MPSPTVVVGGPVNGNIGSCQVNPATYKVDLLHSETIAVNSCSGVVVADHVYLDSDSITLGVLATFFFMIVAVLIKINKINRKRGW